MRHTVAELKRIREKTLGAHPAIRRLIHACRGPEPTGESVNVSQIEWKEMAGASEGFRRQHPVGKRI